VSNPLRTREKGWRVDAATIGSLEVETDNEGVEG